MSADALSNRDLRTIEQVATELAGIAGAEIVTALGGLLAVHYKGGATEDEDTLKWRDPVSEIDHKVETLIRTRLAELFPEHDIIGEEIDERPGRDHDVVWAVDPVDGTANFINGFPIFAASIGVLHRGRPVAGALWCSISHALHPGVYHARAGGKLRFDGSEIGIEHNPAVRRRLAGVPEFGDQDGVWDTRKTGSAAIECAMVAAGLLQVARFLHPNLWDIAGGVALVEAAGLAVRQSEDAVSWTRFDCFEPCRGPSGATDLRYWRRNIVIGEAAAVEQMCVAEGGV
jgi:myo-inositol-1(or 4)-monophosphatase